MPLSSHVPELAALEVLLAVARTGSLNGAAREVGVSQQAVSARIRSLEAQTGVPLVRRTPQGSKLTAEGVVVAEWAGRLLEVAGELDLGLAALRQDRHSRLRVSASLTVAEQLLPGWLVAFRASGEDAEVVLTATNSDSVVAQVESGAADLGFIEGPRVPRSLRSRAVGRDELVLVVGPTHPWARRRRPISPAELAETPLVAREAGSGTREALESALAAHGRRPVPPVLALSTASAIRAAVRAGAAPAVLSELAVADDLAAGHLVRVPLAELDLRRVLRALWRGGAVPAAGPARDLVALIHARAR